MTINFLLQVAHKTEQPVCPYGSTEQPAPPSSSTEEPAPPSSSTEEPAPPSSSTEEPAPPYCNASTSTAPDEIVSFFHIEHAFNIISPNLSAKGREEAGS